MMVSMINMLKIKMKEESKSSDSDVDVGGVGESTNTSEVTVLKTNTIDNGHGTGEAADIHNDDDDKDDQFKTSCTDCSIESSTNRSINNKDDMVTFPTQLMDLIEKETVDDSAAVIEGQKVIEWLPKGDKFIIRDKLTLESCVLPKYFNKCKFMSFVRKLYR
jgi:hypothetical protein